MPKKTASKPKRKVNTDYRPSQHLHLWFSPQFIAVCRLLEVKPVEVLMVFIYDVGSRVTVSGSLVDQKATEYLVSKDFGKKFFNKDQVKQMLTEIGMIDTINPLFTGTTKEELDQYYKVKREYLKIWKSRWEGIKSPRIKKLTNEK